MQTNYIFYQCTFTLKVYNVSYECIKSVLIVELICFLIILGPIAKWKQESYYMY